MGPEEVAAAATLDAAANDDGALEYQFIFYDAGETDSARIKVENLDTVTGAVTSQVTLAVSSITALFLSYTF